MDMKGVIQLPKQRSLLPPETTGQKIRGLTSATASIHDNTSPICLASFHRKYVFLLWDLHILSKERTDVGSPLSVYVPTRKLEAWQGTLAQLQWYITGLYVATLVHL